MAGAQPQATGRTAGQAAPGHAGSWPCAVTISYPRRRCLPLTPPAPAATAPAAPAPRDPAVRPLATPQPPVGRSRVSAWPRSALGVATAFAAPPATQAFELTAGAGLGAAPVVAPGAEAVSRPGPGHANYGVIGFTAQAEAAPKPQAPAHRRRRGSPRRAPASRAAPRRAGLSNVGWHDAQRDRRLNAVNAAVPQVRPVRRLPPGRPDGPRHRSRRRHHVRHDPRATPIASFLQAHAGELNIKYLIWRQRIWYPGGSWQGMADRGSPTANHIDHVHVSVNSDRSPPRFDVTRRGLGACRASELRVALRAAVPHRRRSRLARCPDRLAPVGSLRPGRPPAPRRTRRRPPSCPRRRRPSTGMPSDRSPSQLHPAAPKVTSTERGRDARLSASCSASCSLTTSGSARAATSCGRAAYGAALTTTARPAPWARARRPRTVADGHLELEQQDVARSEVRQRPAAVDVTWPLAPGMTTMAFSPSSSTVIQA